MSPSEFWKMSFGEFWAIAKALDPTTFNNSINNNGSIFSDEELEELAEMKRKWG